MWLLQDVHLDTPPQNGCREMSRFVHKAVNIILQRFIFFIVEDQHVLNCCNSLIPAILIDARVLLKLCSFFTRKCVNYHSSQLVKYCSWNMFLQQICNIFQRVQLVQRDEPPRVLLCALVQAVA